MPSVQYHNDLISIIAFLQGQKQLLLVEPSVQRNEKSFLHRFLIENLNKTISTINTNFS